MMMVESYIGYVVAAAVVAFIGYKMWKKHMNKMDK